MIGSLAWPMSAFVQGLPGQTHVKKGLLALSLLCLPGGSHAAQNPNDYFCRRWGHQTTVIDDKIYIDGGYLYYPSLPTKTNPSKQYLVSHRYISRGNMLTCDTLRHLAWVPRP